MPGLAIKCINSWKQCLPEYELRLWNEDSFDIQSIPYVKEAWNAHKYAFVTDYVRLYALYHFGGIYMDTDVEVLKSLDDLLCLPGFSGFESEKDVPTGIIACEKHNVWAKEQLDWYEGKHFIRQNGMPDTKSNVEIISGNMAAHGFLLKNSYQVYKGCMHIFPKDYFCPKSRTGLLAITPNTYCIHHFEGSWLPWNRKLKKFFFKHILGAQITDFLVSAKKSVIKRQSKLLNNFEQKLNYIKL